MILIALFFGGFVTAAAILPLKISRMWKIILGVLVFIGAFKTHIFYLLGGPLFFAPDLPLFVLRAGTFYYGVIFFLANLLGISWIFWLPFGLIQYARKKTNWPVWRKWYNRITAVLLIPAVILTVWSLRWGDELPEVKYVTIPLADLPPQANGMTIAILTDLHIDKQTPEDKLPLIVARCNALKPDLTVVLGDCVDGSLQTFKKKLHPLSELKAKYGIYGVPGNHEYYSGYRPWVHYFSKLGIKMLLNDAVQLPNGLWLAGVTDRTAKHYGEELPAPERTAAKIPAKTASILLAHQPRMVRRAQNHYSLQLSGHTHGGMIIGLNYLIQWMTYGYVSGLYQTPGKMKLYISNGAAIWQGFPIRLGCPSEITLIRLKNQ